MTFTSCIWIAAVILGLLAQSPLHAGMTPEEVQAFTWHKSDAEKGVADAQYKLGLCYSEGLGVAKDPVQAILWWRKAAEQGDAMAQFKIGNSY